MVGDAALRKVVRANALRAIAAADEAPARRGFGFALLLAFRFQQPRREDRERARAVFVLRARLMAMEQEKREKAEAQSRKLQVGSGDRSERIRTYNFPQGRVTDHRINLTIYKLDEVMNGALEQVIKPLQQEYQAEELARIVE